MQVRESSFISDTFGDTRDFAQRSEDVRHILDGLEAELLKMVDWVASSDTLLCVPMLGEYVFRMPYSKRSFTHDVAVCMQARLLGR